MLITLFCWYSHISLMVQAGVCVYDFPVDVKTVRVAAVL